MILIYYTRQIFPNGKKILDYTSVNNVEEFVDWYAKLGDQLIFSLIKKNRSLTQIGWDKVVANSANVLQAFDTVHQMLITINSVVSDEGILFEDVNHCSEQIVDEIALKCVTI